MSDIRLYVSCHTPAPVPEYPLLVPIQVGSALSPERFPGFLRDDAGENISGKNRSYCELTAQYWAWKNVRADYYGFFHYRRYLYPDTSPRQPYRIEGSPTPELLDKLGCERFPELISHYDLILPKGEDMRLSVREHYAKAPFHHKKDLELAEAILREKYPEYGPAAEEYLSGTVCYFGNIYIMTRGVCEDYCGWLFSILEEFDRRSDTKGYGPQEKRVDGYLAERLLGIYAVHHREWRTLELPRVHFVADPRERRKKKLVNFLLPPGSKKRSIVKGWLTHGDRSTAAEAPDGGAGDPE